MECRFCEGYLIKKGIKNGNQCYQCKQCKKYQKQAYKNKACSIPDKIIVACVKEGMGIRGISRFLRIAQGTVLSRIKRIASRTPKPPIPLNRSFEVDQVFTFIGNKNKRTCIVIALEQESGSPVEFYIGPRSKKTLRMVTSTLLATSPRLIFTDRLIHYKSLIPPHIHKTKLYGTNRLERLNLTIRTHLKRLNRRSIAFSRSPIMLLSCLIIYFWG